MATLTASTEDVIKLIKYTKLTAYTGKDDPAMSSIVLYTTTGHIGDDPGGSTILVGMSSDGAVAGQYAIPVTGTLPTPAVIPSTDISWLATMLATDLRQNRDADTSVQLDFDIASGALRVRALADGVEGPDDRRGVVGLDTSDSYPLRSTAKLLEVDPDVSGESGAVRVELPATYQSLMATASKMASAAISLYPVEGSESKVLAFLPSWRAVFPYGMRVDPGEVVSHSEWAMDTSNDKSSDA